MGDFVQCVCSNINDSANILSVVIFFFTSRTIPETAASFLKWGEQLIKNSGNYD